MDLNRSVLEPKDAELLQFPNSGTSLGVSDYTQESSGNSEFSALNQDPVFANHMPLSPVVSPQCHESHTLPLTHTGSYHQWKHNQLALEEN